MNENAANSDQQVLPRLAGYESWLYQMPCIDSTGDVFVSIGLPGQTSHFDELPSRWLIALGDVYGKGEPASRLKELLEATITRLADSMTDPASLLTALNADSLELAEEGYFATLLVAVIDSDRHELTIANAGHMPPVLRRVDRRVDMIAEGIAGYPLWIVPTQCYESQTAPIGRGEMMIFHSDGLTATIDNPDCLFDLTKLGQAVSRASDGAASAGLSILDAIRCTGQGRPQQDDITLLCVSRAVTTARSPGTPTGQVLDRVICNG